MDGEDGRTADYFKVAEASRWLGDRANGGQQQHLQQHSYRAGAAGVNVSPTRHRQPWRLYPGKSKTFDEISKGTGKSLTEQLLESTSPPAPASLRFTESGAEVLLAHAEEGVSPGQACVFYGADDERVLGGGWISAARLSD